MLERVIVDSTSFYEKKARKKQLDKARKITSSVIKLFSSSKGPENVKYLIQ